MKFLLHDGTIKDISQLTLQDTLLGHKSECVPIREIVKHVGKLYSVQFENNECYLIGEHQILNFRRQGSLDIFRITLIEYLNTPPTVREHYRAFTMPCIEFVRQVTLENAYEKGAAVEEQIPKLYRCSTSHSRRELLAGLIDEKGELRNDKFMIPCTWQLAQDILFIARSLGYHTWYDGKSVIIDRWRVSQLHKLKVRKVGEGEYYSLKTDGSYLLDNFVVIG